MDRLAKGVEQLNVGHDNDEDKDEEWRMVGSSGKRSQRQPDMTTSSMTKIDPGSLLKSAQMLLEAYFPTCRREDLTDLLEKFEGDINESMNALLDSGYSMAEEVVVVDVEETKSNSKAQNINVRGQQGVPDQAEAVQIPSTSVDEGSSSSNNLPDGIIGAEGGNPPPPNDTDETEDWMKVPLPRAFVQKLASIYGDPDDPVIQAMLQCEDGIETALPPRIVFSMYRKLVKNAEAKAWREAQEAAKD